MSKRLRRACLASAALLVAEFFGFTAAAKPPDLPVNYYDDYLPADTSEGQPAPQTEPAPAPQPASRTKRTSKARTKRDKGSITDTTTDRRRLNEARRLFQIGERCRRDGDLDMAVNCYQETHLLAPMSRYGLLAIERLGKIDAQRAAEAVGTVEEQETPETVPPANAGGEQVQRQDAAEDGKLAAAREMFVIAERCRHTGDLDMALNCYHEAHLLAPDSIYGRQAQVRIREIRAARQAEQDSSEEQEPTPEQSFDAAKILGPIPGGCVVVSPTMLWAVPNSSPTGPPGVPPGPPAWLFKQAPAKPQKRRTAPPSRDEGQQSRVYPANPLELEIVQEKSSSSNEAGDEVSASTEQQPLFVTPPARRLMVQTEESTTSGDAPVPSPAEFQGWLRQTGDVLRSVSGIDIDVDVSGSGSVRFKGAVQAAGLTGTIIFSETGSYFKGQQPAASSQQQVFPFFTAISR